MKGIEALLAKQPVEVLEAGLERIYVAVASRTPAAERFIDLDVLQKHWENLVNQVQEAIAAERGSAQRRDLLIVQLRDVQELARGQARRAERLKQRSARGETLVALSSESVREGFLLRGLRGRLRALRSIAQQPREGVPLPDTAKRIREAQNSIGQSLSAALPARTP